MPCWFPLHRGWYWKIKKNIPFLYISSYQITKLQPGNKNISTHTKLKFQIFHGKKKVENFFHTAYKKIKAGDVVHIGAYCVVQTLYKRQKKKFVCHNQTDPIKTYIRTKKPALEQNKKEKKKNLPTDP